MKMRKLAIFLFSIVPMIEPTDAQTRWEVVGTYEGASLSIDMQGVRNRDYPLGSTSILSRPMGSYVSYMEVWAKSVDPSGQTDSQYLWAFDCDGRAAQLVRHDLKNNTSTDVTARAQVVGVKPYLERIPPESIFEIVQEKVCPTKPH
jgi:hypothetical protein